MAEFVKEEKAEKAEKVHESRLLEIHHVHPCAVYRHSLPLQEHKRPNLPPAEVTCVEAPPPEPKLVEA